MVDLPAEFAHVVDPQSATRDAGDFDLLRGEPAERFVAQVCFAQLAEQVARPRPNDDQVAPGVRHVLELDPLPFEHALAQGVVVLHLPGGSREDVEALARQPRDRGLALDASGLVQQMGELDPAVSLRHSVGEHAIQKLLGVGPRDVELGEARELEHAHALGHRAAFLPHDFEDVVPAVGELLLPSVE